MTWSFSGLALSKQGWFLQINTRVYGQFRSQSYRMHSWFLSEQGPPISSWSNGKGRARSRVLLNHRKCAERDLERYLMRHESHGLYKWSQWRGKARWKTSSRKGEVTTKSKESRREKWTEDRARTLTLRTKPALFYSDQNQASKCKTRAVQVRAGVLSNWSFPVCWQSGGFLYI